MLTLCYYETDKQLSDLMADNEFRGLKFVLHTDVKALIEKTIEVTSEMLNTLDMLAEGESFQVFEVEQYKAVLDRMVKHENHIVYAVQVKYVEEGFLETKTVVPKSVADGYMPTVTGVGGIHQLLLLKDDTIDRVLMHAVVQ